MVADVFLGRRIGDCCWGRCWGNGGLKVETRRGGGGGGGGA